MTTQELICGDARAVLCDMEEESVHCVVTSPPYWGLRSYKDEPQVWGGEPECRHEWGDESLRAVGRNDHGTGCPTSRLGPQKDGLPGGTAIPNAPASTGQFCTLCSAWRGCLGLEPTIEMYLEHIVEVFQAVKRVLRKDGTLWLNLGDSYATQGGRGEERMIELGRPSPGAKQTPGARGMAPGTKLGLKPKDLCMIPARVALALQADGWWLRSDIIWSKPNSMPESVTDRPTTSHEHIFLLTKSARYFYDADAVREPYDPGSLDRYKYALIDTAPAGHQPGGTIERREVGKKIHPPNPAGRNPRSVWEIATQPFPEAHFATYPERLVSRCILAGTSEKGCCPECGAPWERVVEKDSRKRNELPTDHKDYRPGFYTNGKAGDPQCPGPGQRIVTTITLGWQPTCECELEPEPCTVLDPFVGSGTTLVVAKKVGRNGVGIDVQPAYIAMAQDRLAKIQGPLPGLL